MTNDRYLRACRLEPTEVVPVWFMRQAGRCLPEYRALREKHSLLEICRTPELAVEATLQPVRRLGVDAAILFSDIMVPLAPMGVDVDIVEGRGPVIAQPIRNRSDASRLHALDPEEDVSFVLQAIKLLADELEVPLIGFAGAPFTLACYLVEGGPSRDYARVKALMHSDRDTWEALMEILANSIGAYLRSQVAAGAAAVQLFDSWAGTLAPRDYETYVQPHVARIFDQVRDLDAPRIAFGVTTGELLPAMVAAGADVIGVDWRTPLDAARTRVGGGVALQGNLDPAVCLSTWDAVAAAATDVLERGGGEGHIFNLGHGVHPDTDPDVLARIVDLVHGWSPRR
jgi:uroporphyrinogen decarboxylase